MTRRIVTLVPLFAFAYLAGIPGRCAIADDPQNNAPAATQSSSNQQQSTANSSNESNQDQSTSNSRDEQQQNDSQSNASSQGKAKEDSNSSLPAPAASDNRGVADRSQDQSVLKDNANSRQAQTSSRAEASSRDRSPTGNPNESRDHATNDRDRMQRDLHAGIRIGKTTNRGLTINRVTRNSVFYESGLRDGDVIVSISGRPVRSQADFDRVVVFEPGRRIPFVVLRDGRQQTVYITFRPEIASRNRTYDTAGSHFGVEFDPQIQDAAVILRVEDGSPAERAGLRQNDTILSLNGKRITSPNDAMQVIESSRPGDHLNVEYGRQARVEVVLQEGREHEVARRPVDTEIRVDAAEPDARRSDRNRDSDARERNRDREDRGLRGLLPGRRR